MTDGKEREPKIIATNRGTGALCASAQADGVPCFELGKDCEVCDRAFHNARNEAEDEENE